METLEQESSSIADMASNSANGFAENPNISSQSDQSFAVKDDVRTRFTAAAPNKDAAIAEEATTQQILSFWNHPSLQHVSPSQKQAYLKHKGITEDQVFSAWDRIMESQQNQGGSKKTEDWVSSFQSQQQQQEPNVQLQPQPQQSTQYLQQPANSSSFPPQPNTQPAHHPPTTAYNTSYETNTNTNRPYPYDDYEDEDGTFSAPNIALIATVGGFLGLMAAATVRWLNGGDFLLFPPPSRDSATTKARVLALRQQEQPLESQNSTTMEEEDNEVEDDDDDEEDDSDNDDAELARYLSSSPPIPSVQSDAKIMQQTMSQLTETFQQHVTVQQRLLQKLTNSNTASGPTVTDKSMQLLRNHQQQNTKKDGENDKSKVSDPMLWYKLVEIQVELASLKRDWSLKEDSGALEKQLGDTLQHLQTVLDGLKPQGSPKSEQAEDADKNQSNAATESTPTRTNSTASLDDRDQDIPDKAPAQTPASPDDKPEAPWTSPAESETPTTQTTTVQDDKSQILRQVRTAIIDLVRQNADNLVLLKGATQVLYLYVSNLSKNPHVPRYRKVFTSNQSYKNVEQLKGGRAFLCAIGFVPSSDDRVLEWPPAPEGEAELTAQDKEALVQTYHLSEVAAALAILKSVKAKDGSDADQTATLSLLEKALDVLPCPSEGTSVPQEKPGVQEETENAVSEGNESPAESPGASVDKGATPGQE